MNKEYIIDIKEIQKHFPDLDRIVIKLPQKRARRIFKLDKKK